MTDQRVAKIKRALVATAGGYLRNPGGPGTCTRCYTPTIAGPMCPDCRYAAAIQGGPDLLGFMSYAGYLDPITQSGHMMRGYKSQSIPQATHWQTVALMSALALIGHVSCPGQLVGMPINAWATVPSLPPKPAMPVHPLHDIVQQLARPGASEVRLQAAVGVTAPRGINRDHFTVSDGATPGQHVLLIDDTWTSGGHAMSAALALRAAGAAHVSVLVLARWLSIGWEATTVAWAKQRLVAPDFQPDICPWTQASCP